MTAVRARGAGVPRGDKEGDDTTHSNKDRGRPWEALSVAEVSTTGWRCIPHSLNPNPSGM